MGLDEIPKEPASDLPPSHDPHCLEAVVMAADGPGFKQRMPLVPFRHAKRDLAFEIQVVQGAGSLSVPMTMPSWAEWAQPSCALEEKKVLESAPWRAPQFPNGRQ
jgi:hypothetical protein